MCRSAGSWPRSASRWSLRPCSWADTSEHGFHGARPSTSASRARTPSCSGRRHRGGHHCRPAAGVMRSLRDDAHRGVPRRAECTPVRPLQARPSGNRAGPRAALPRQRPRGTRTRGSADAPGRGPRRVPAPGRRGPTRPQRAACVLGARRLARAPRRVRRDAPDPAAAGTVAREQRGAVAMKAHLVLDPIACDGHGLCAELLPERDHAGRVGLPDHRSRAGERQAPDARTPGGRHLSDARAGPRAQPAARGHIARVSAHVATDRAAGRPAPALWRQRAARPLAARRRVREHAGKWCVHGRHRPAGPSRPPSRARGLRGRPRRRPGGAPDRASQPAGRWCRRRTTSPLSAPRTGAGFAWLRVRTWSAASSRRQVGSMPARRSTPASCCWCCSRCTSRASPSLHRYTSVVDPIRFLAGFHGLAAGAATLLVAGHVYLAVLHPATRHALRGITLGTVRRDWAEDHHADWVDVARRRSERLARATITERTPRLHSE